MATIHDVMNDEHMLSVPVTATTSIGKSWGSVEDV
jgi:DNA polymerase I-like protein with 3'-5' exonuclease and polymerase domains